MTPLAKPGKPRGPVTSLRPIVPQDTIRKALPILIMKRITPAVEPHFGQTQSGFRRVDERKGPETRVEVPYAQYRYELSI